MAWEITGNSGTDPALNFLGTTDSQPLAVRTAGSERLRVAVDGRVGIGTTTPGSALDVRGTLLTGPIVQSDSSGNAYPDNWIGMANNIEGSTRWLHIGGITDGGVRRLTLYADRTYFSGNVGIGTTTPGSALDVRGTLLTGPIVQSDSSGNAYPDNWIGMANNIEGSTRWLHIGGIPDGGVRRLALYADRTFIGGRVGIGTTAPSEALTVAGSIRITQADSFFQMGASKRAPQPEDHKDLQGRRALRGQTHTSAVCVNGDPSSGSTNLCGCAGGRLISRVFSACTVTSDTGSCSALSATTPTGFTRSGSCCVCAP